MEWDNPFQRTQHMSGSVHGNSPKTPASRVRIVSVYLVSWDDDHEGGGGSLEWPSLSGSYAVDGPAEAAAEIAAPEGARREESATAAETASWIAAVLSRSTLSISPSAIICTCGAGPACACSALDAARANASASVAKNTIKAPCMAFNVICDVGLTAATGHSIPRPKCAAKSSVYSGV